MKKKFNPQETERALIDITGLVNSQTKEVLKKGLSDEKIPLSEKVKLNILVSKLNGNHEAYDKTKKQLISTSYPKGLTVEIEKELQMSGDKRYLKMVKELSELYNNKEGVEIDFQPISTKKIDSLISDNDYSWLVGKIGD